MPNNADADRFGAARQVATDNAWLLPCFALAGVAATFFFAGLVPALIGIGFVLCVAVVALANSVRRLRIAGIINTTPSPIESRHGYIESASKTSLGTEANESTLIGPEGGDLPSPTGVSPSAEHGPLTQIIAAAFDKTPDAIDEPAAEYIGLARTDAERLDHSALVLRFRVMAGDSTALNQLAELATSNPTDPNALRYYAIALEDLGEPGRAAEVIKTHIGQITASRSGLQTRESQLWLRASQPVSAIDAAGRAERDAETDTQLANACAARGWALLEAQQKHAGFAALEHSVELDPSDGRRRFDLAYAYSDAGLTELALHHLERCLSFKDQAVMARNNLGVALDRLELKIMANERFREAGEGGNSLAAANLANNFVTAGMRDEARKWLKIGGGAAEVHGNIHEIAGRLAAAEAAEEQAATEVRTRAQKLREAVLAWSDPASQVLPVGEWAMDEGVVLQFSASDEQSVAEPSEHRALRVVKGDYGLVVKWQQGQYASELSGVASCDGAHLYVLIEGQPKPGTWTAHHASASPTTAVTD